MASMINAVGSKERYIILDFLRGIALLGICLANFPEFALYTFLPAETVAAMPTAGVDKVVKYVQYIFIDGKFYTIFSLLFGIGFSIILSNAAQKNKNGMWIFYRRMIVLLLIGLFHLIGLWAGDILILYALLGLFLPIFRHMSDKKLWIGAILFLLLPILVDTCILLFEWNLAAPVIRATAYFHGKAGITEANFPIWLAEANSYADVLKFNVAGAFIRMQEFIEGNRAFKVMGLFLIGFYIGRNRMYARLKEYAPGIRKIRNIGFSVGLPLSVVYAWNAMHGYALGLTGSAVLYAVSVFPLSFAYIAAICLYYLKKKAPLEQQKLTEIEAQSKIETFSKNEALSKIETLPEMKALPEVKTQSQKIEPRIFKLPAAAGRMALTNYIMQSVFGIILFYGIGFQLGAKVGLVYVELMACAVFAIQVLYSHLWLRHFRFGPLEWGWRMLTYGGSQKIEN